MPPVRERRRVDALLLGRGPRETFHDPGKPTGLRDERQGSMTGYPAQAVIRQ